MTAVVVETLPDDDQRSMLGFSAQDLAWAMRSDTTVARWREVPGVASNAAPGEVPLHLEFTRSEGNAVVEDTDCGVLQLSVPIQLTSEIPKIMLRIAGKPAVEPRITMIRMMKRSVGKA